MSPIDCPSTRASNEEIITDWLGSTEEFTFVYFALPVIFFLNIYILFVKRN